MSTFEENFERDENKEMQFDTNAFYPVLESIIIMLIFYFLYKIYSYLFKYKIKYQDTTKYRNCPCKDCKKRLNDLVKKKTNNKNLIFYIGSLSFLILVFSIYYKKILETQNKIKVFNPFEILEISESATAHEIKKAYKKLALKYHPDKNLNNLQAKAQFMLVTKAYEALTNEDAKKNYELYGNPDGPGSMRLSIGLPSTFILNKKNHFKILIIFIFIICVIIPYYFIQWFSITYKYDENGILNSTKKFFMQKTNEESQMKDIPFLLGCSLEFRRINDSNIMNEKIEIEELFYKYKNHFPKEINNENINLIYKKSIAIAYAYSFGERNDKNYLKLTKKNEYIFLLAKLLDAFFECHNAKNQIFKIFEIQGQDPNNIAFSKVKNEFLRDILSYQQCFYQGIPIQKIQQNISFIQLPYINTENLHLITENLEKINFRQFMKLNDENKKIFLKKVFNFNEEEISEIIEVTHSIPQYEYKIKYYVDGFENTDILPKDIITFKITITRKNVGKLQLGIGHSKHFPGLFNECIYFLVLIGEKIINQEKIVINKKISEYNYNIRSGVVGKNNIKFLAIPSCFCGQNEEIDVTFQAMAKSDRRKEFINLINKRKEKIPLSYIQEGFKEFGVKINIDSDDEEEEEEEKEEEENKQNKEKTMKQNEENKKEEVKMKKE